MIWPAILDILMDILMVVQVQQLTKNNFGSRLRTLVCTMFWWNMGRWDFSERMLEMMLAASAENDPCAGIVVDDVNT